MRWQRLDPSVPCSKSSRAFEYQQSRLRLIVLHPETHFHITRETGLLFLLPDKRIGLRECGELLGLPMLNVELRPRPLLVSLPGGLVTVTLLPRLRLEPRQAPHLPQDTVNTLYLQAVCLPTKVLPMPPVFLHKHRASRPSSSPGSACFLWKPSSRCLLRKLPA